MAISTIPSTALADPGSRDRVPTAGFTPDPPAVSSGLVTMATILSGFALFWLIAGFGLGYWLGS